MNLKAGLAVSEIRALRERVERYANGLQAKADELCRRLAEIGVDAAVAGIAHDESGELRGSIRWEQRGERVYLVVADCDYAVYVEFGTGVVGAGSAYPGERPEWVGAPGSRSSHVNPDGSWVYYDEKQGRMRVTSGQVPQGFMAGSAVEVQQQIAGIAREVFAGD